MELFQHTIGDTITLRGEGIITGKDITVELIPSPPNHGLVFERTDLSPSLFIRVAPENVFATEGASLIRSGHDQILFIEHLLATLNGLAIDNLLIRVNGPEIPLLDGSALPFVEAILEVGRRPQWSLRRHLRIVSEFTIKSDDSEIIFRPAPELRLHCIIDFPHPVIGHQEIELTVTPESFLSEIAYARTFGFLQELIKRREQGLLRGGSLENAIILDADRVLNPDGLRDPKEFARHKLLDFMGDIYILGAPILGAVKVIKSSHKFHIKAIKTLLAHSNVWDWFPGPARLPVKPMKCLEPACALA